MKNQILFSGCIYETITKTSKINLEISIPPYVFSGCAICTQEDNRAPIYNSFITGCKDQEGNELIHIDFGRAWPIHLASEFSKLAIEELKSSL